MTTIKAANLGADNDATGFFLPDAGPCAIHVGEGLTGTVVLEQTIDHGITIDPVYVDGAIYSKTGPVDDVYDSGGVSAIRLRVEAYTSGSADAWVGQRLKRVGG